MKEKICADILEKREYDKWCDIINSEVLKEPSIMKYEREENTEDEKNKYNISIGGNDGNELYSIYDGDISVIVEHFQECRYDKKIKDGWFGYITIYKWESVDYPLDYYKYLFTFSIRDNSISVYEKDVYDFCKKFGKKYKLKTLYKCWDGVE